jgi:hypothetical protein
MSAGNVRKNHNRFQLQPYANAQGKISGLGVNIMGLGFILMLEPLDLGLNPHLLHAKYRPGEISISYPSSLNVIAISWNDGKRHASLSMQFMYEVGRIRSNMEGKRAQPLSRAHCR